MSQLSAPRNIGVEYGSLQVERDQIDDIFDRTRDRYRTPASNASKHSSLIADMSASGPDGNVTDAFLYRVVDYVESLLEENSIDLCDDLLRSTRLDTCDIDVMLALASCTLAAKHVLNARDTFMRNVRAELIRRGIAGDEMDEMLDGL